MVVVPYSSSRRKMLHVKTTKTREATIGILEGATKAMSFLNSWNLYLSSVQIQNRGWLFDVGDSTTQLYGDYNKPI